MRSYRALLLVVVALAIVLSVAARLPHRPRAREATPPPVPVTTLSLEVEAGHVRPEVASVPKGHRVLLSVTNYGRTSVTLMLAGYEGRLSPGVIGPDQTWRAEFLADLPGEDFAWFLDGQPAGRLVVTGSHLVEGHR